MSSASLGVRLWSGCTTTFRVQGNSELSPGSRFAHNYVYLHDRPVTCAAHA